MILPPAVLAEDRRSAGVYNSFLKIEADASSLIEAGFF